MNKNSGEMFSETVPAKFIYCKSKGMNSWVFRHPNILTAPPDFPEKEVSCHCPLSFSLSLSLSLSSLPSNFLCRMNAIGSCALGKLVNMIF